MFSQRLFKLVSRLIFSCWVRDYEEHHGACEDAYTARIGPLHLEINRCFVLDHDDAGLSVRIPTPWGRLHLGYVACLGEDEIRRPGFHTHWHKRLIQADSVSKRKVRHHWGCERTNNTSQAKL